MSKGILGEIRQVLELQAGLLRELARLLERLENAYEEDERFYPVREAAQRLGVGESTLRRLISQGKLRATRIGGKVVVPASELRRLAEGGL